MYRKIFYLFALLFLLYGCGKTNVLQWTLPPPEQDHIEQARLAIDEAKYDKALALVKDDSSSEGRIIYAEALLGLADLDLASILDALTDDKVTDNPVIRLDEKLLRGKNNSALIIRSGDIFLTVTPEKKSDQVIGVLATMAAHTANLKQAFDPEDKGLIEIINDLSAQPDSELIDVSPNYKILCGTENISEIDAALHYADRAVELFSYISKDEDIEKALNEMHETMVSVNTVLTVLDSVENIPPEYAGYIKEPGYRPWGLVQAIFGL